MLKHESSSSGNQEPTASNQEPPPANQAPRTRNQEPPSSSSTSTGKIACLPKAIREQLNRRLDDGERGPKVLAWLNALPEVRTVLKDSRFRGQPITEQNLSNWRLGGFVRWQNEQQDQELFGLMRDEAANFQHAAGGQPGADFLSPHLTLALCRLLATAEKEPDPARRQQSILSITHEYSLLRRGDLAARRLQMDLEDRAAARQKARTEELAALADDDFKALEHAQLAKNKDWKILYRVAHEVQNDCYVSSKNLPEVFAKLVRHEPAHLREIKAWEVTARELSLRRTIARCQQDAAVLEDIDARLRRGEAPRPGTENYPRLPEQSRHRLLRRSDQRTGQPPAYLAREPALPKAYRQDPFVDPAMFMQTPPTPNSAPTKTPSTKHQARETKDQKPSAENQAPGTRHQAPQPPPSPAVIASPKSNQLQPTPAPQNSPPVNGSAGGPPAPFPPS